MAIPTEISDALHGAWRLACLDRRGMAYFARGEAAFWRSFRAAIILYPVFLIMLALRPGDPESPGGEWGRVLLVETIGYVISWTAFPLMMLPITRFLGREQLWLDFMIVYNWSQILLAGPFLLASALG